MIRSKEWNFTLIFFRAEISICTVRHIIFLQDKCAVFHVPKLDQKKTINHVMAWERKQRSDFPLFPLSPHPCTSPFPYLFLFLPSCLISSPLRPPSSPFHPSSISSLLCLLFAVFLFFSPVFWTVFPSHVFLPVFVRDRVIFLFIAWLRKKGYVVLMINLK